MSQRATEPGKDLAAGEQAAQDGGSQPDERLLIDPLRRWPRMAAALAAPVTLCMLLSLVGQVGFVLYLVLEVPPPPRPSMSEIIDDRIVRVTLLEAPAEPPPPPSEEQPEPVAAVEPEPAPPPPPQAEPEEEPTPEPEPEPALEEPPQPDGLALQGIGSGTAGGPIPMGNRSPTEVAPPRRSTRGHGGGGDARPQSAEDDQHHGHHERPRPVRLEEAGTPPRLAAGEPELDYPREFRERALAGVVVVQCIITENGHVRACRQRAGPDELAQYVISVVRQWRYEPALDHRGAAIAVAYTYRVPFRLL